MSNGNIFWNATERRLRALWRLLIQGIAWSALMFIGQGVIGAIWGILAVATGSVSLEELSDPAAATEFIMGQPGLVIGLQVVSLVAMVASGCLAGRFLDKRRFAEFGLRIDRRWWEDFGFGLALGAVLMALIFAVELAAGWVTVTGTFVTSNPETPFVVAILAPLLTLLAAGGGDD